MNKSGDVADTESARRALLGEREGLRARLRELDAALGENAGSALLPDLAASWEPILDALPALIALLDGDGRIIWVNQAWRRFGIANGVWDASVGVDYLAVCDGAQGHAAEEAGEAAEGIRTVLAGARGQYALEYPCHLPDEQRWFRMLVAQLGRGPGCVVLHIDITDRKLAEESLRVNEARLRALLDAEPECVKVVSADGRLLSMNPAGLRMIQAEDFAQVAGRPVGDLIHPDDRDAFRDLHRRVLAGATAQLEFRMLGMQGGEFWMDSHSTPLRNEDGSVQGVLSITRDITSRRAADAKLASLQQLHHNILDSVAEGIVGIDLEGRVRFANPAAVSILGWSEQELVGQHKHAFVHHHYADGRVYPQEACPILRTLRDSAPRREDREVFFHRDGTAIPVEYVVSPVLGSDAAGQGAVVCFRDISQRLADEAAVAGSEERFRLAARATVNAIWDWDVLTDTVLWSGGLEKLFGLSDEYLQSDISSWSERVHPEDRQRVSTSLERAVEGRVDRWEEEYRFARPDGTYATVIDSGHVMRDAQGNAVRMVGGLSDVSRMRTLEAQLRASQRLEAVGQLTGGIAHDFNNLLTVVLGNAEMLQEQLPDGTIERELADMIMAAANRGSSLTQRLLAFARRQALDARPLRLGELVQGMKHLVQKALGEHIELVIRSCAHDWVLADGAQLENALLNLCITARDAMPNGGRLTISVTEASLAPSDIDPLSRSNPGQFVRLDVQDTGVGIDPKVLPLVIEPFFTTKETGKGTGLGLSMVYGLVKQSNGYLDIRSELGQGTSVRIHLPRVTAAEGSSDTDGELADASVIEGGHEHLLLVEDDELVRRFAATRLQALGYRVSEAEDAMQALELLRGDGRIDLMLTDVMMPGLNGAELAEAAGRLCPDMPVLFISGYSEDALTSEGRLPDGVLLLTKPYPKAELARRVRQALS